MEITTGSAWNSANLGGPNPELARSFLNSLPQGAQVGFLVILHFAAFYGVYKLLRTISPGRQLRALRVPVYVLLTMAYVHACYKVTLLAGAYPLILPLLAPPVHGLLVA